MARRCVRVCLHDFNLWPKWLVGLLVLLPLLSSHSGFAAPGDQVVVFKVGHRIGYAEGRFENGVREVYFSFRALEGEHLRVTITPLTPDLITAGVVISPSGKEDGGPGGVVFDSVLTETGEYRIRVTQRQADFGGRFRVVVIPSKKGSQ